MEPIIFQCLYCQDYFLLYQNEFNCRILRHAVHKKTFQPINPHTSKEECDRLIEKGEIYGCAKPLRIIEENGAFKVEKCDYI